MKRYVYRNHPWLQKWVEEYHLENIKKYDTKGSEIAWLLFKITYATRGKRMRSKLKSYFASRGITVTRNKKKQLVFHISKKMKTWLILQGIIEC